MEDAEKVIENSEQKDPVEDTSIKFDTCPCCGKPTLKRPVKPSRDLVDHWFSCMLTNTPFNYTYKLYDGKLSVTVAQPDASTVVKVDRVCTILDDCRTMEELKDLDIAQLRSLIRIYIQILDIRIKNLADMKTYQPCSIIRDILDRILAADQTDKSALCACVREQFIALTLPVNVSAVPYRVLLAVLQTHSNICEILLSSGFDSNFWTGIELA